MIILRSWLWNVLQSVCIRIIFLRRRCVRIMKAMFSAVWDAEASCHLGRMRTATISLKVDLIRVLSALICRRSVFWRKGMKKYSGNWWTNVCSYALRRLCAVTMRWRVHYRMSVLFTGSTVRLPVWIRVRRLIRFCMAVILPCLLAISDSMK